PDERLRRLVGDAEVFPNRGLQFPCAPMRPALDLFLSERGEPPLDEVQPRRAGGRQMDVETRVGRQPSPDARGLVGTVVVENEVDVEPVGDLRFNRLEESDELLTAVSSMTLADHLPARHVE